MFYLFRQYCLSSVHQSKWCKICCSRDCRVVAPYRSWHDLQSFAFLISFEYFLDCLKYQNIGFFNSAIGLGMVYICECYLCFNLLTKVLEHCIVKVFYNADYNVAGNIVTTNDILPEELFDGCGAYVCDRLRLNPLCEVLHRHNSEGVISLCWG
jgi:hypothetical protein